MVEHYYYRINKENPENNIKIDYLTEDVKDDDIVLVFAAHLLRVIGIFKKQGEFLVAQKVFEKDKRPDLRNYYDKLSFVEFKGNRTYKLFSKKTRKVNKEDVEMFL